MHRPILTPETVAVWTQILPPGQLSNFFTEAVLSLTVHKPFALVLLSIILGCNNVMVARSEFAAKNNNVNNTVSKLNLILLFDTVLFYILKRKCLLGNHVYKVNCLRQNDSAKSAFCGKEAKAALSIWYRVYPWI